MLWKLVPRWGKRCGFAITVMRIASKTVFIVSRRYILRFKVLKLIDFAVRALSCLQFDYTGNQKVGPGGALVARGLGVCGVFVLCAAQQLVLRKSRELCHKRETGT